MDKILEFLKYILVFISLLRADSDIPGFLSPASEIAYENLGIPLESRYEEGLRARTVWDMEYHDGKIFIGSGDYDSNQGPVDIYAYDISTGLWQNTGTVPDEQVERFVFAGGTLASPGCDPTEAWEWGNVYYYENGQWVTRRTIPGGVHQFDMIDYNGQYFVGLGIVPGTSPVSVSEDGGESYRPVPMYKDGVAIADKFINLENSDAVTRVTDFFVLQNNLFCFYYQYWNGEILMEIYRYEDNAFFYHSDLPQHLVYKRTTYEIVNDKEQFGNQLYFSTGNLYMTQDLKTAQELTLGDREIITDMRVIAGNLYVSSIKKLEDGSFVSSIWVKNPYHSSHFEKLFYFTFDCPVQCFTYYDGVFYLGTGDGRVSPQDNSNGTVLSVAYRL